MTGVRAALILAVMVGAAAVPSRAQVGDRLNVWDLTLGAPLSAQPAVEEFKGYGCGTDGGPILSRIGGFADFLECEADAERLHEVYFEYDDEQEYIARALDNPMNIDRFAGTTDSGHPVMVSALFDDEGVLQKIRILTDPRADYVAGDNRLAVHGRETAYQFGGLVAPRVGVQADRDCVNLEPEDGQSPVADRFIKMRCQRTEADLGRGVFLEIHYFRKPGQHGRDPGVPSKLTIGQYESSTRLELTAL